MLGEVFYNQDGQEYTVVAHAPRNKSGNARWVIRFKETGYEQTVLTVQIQRGKIKDRYIKTIFGVGCIGMASSVDNKRAYGIWYHMLNRCYNPKYSEYKYYGGKSVYVHERWLCFEHFLSDLPFVEGYNEEEFQGNNIVLDKDRKHIGDGPKCYSRLTCIFLTPFENGTQVNRTHLHKTFIAISPEGQQMNVSGIGEFARNHGLTRQAITRCLSNRMRTHQGWRFKHA